MGRVDFVVDAIVVAAVMLVVEANARPDDTATFPPPRELDGVVVVILVELVEVLEWSYGCWKGTSSCKNCLSVFKNSKEWKGLVETPYGTSNLIKYIDPFFFKDLSPKLIYLQTRWTRPKIIIHGKSASVYIGITGLNIFSLTDCW